VCRGWLWTLCVEWFRGNGGEPVKETVGVGHLTYTKDILTVPFVMRFYASQ
jgi:hypothetical protein